MTKSGFWKMPSTLAALGLALALVLTACGGDDNGGGGGGSGFLGATLNLSGNVYTIDDDAFTPPRFTGNRTVVSRPPGGTGEITEGQLSFTFGRPATEYLESIGDFLEVDWGGSVTPANAMGTRLRLRTATGTTENGSLWRVYGTRTATFSRGEEVDFIFVDRDVTMRGERITGSWNNNDYSGTYEYRAFNITLREGWNALRWVWEERVTAPNTFSETMTLSHANPGSPVRWELDDWSRARNSGEPEPLGRTLPGRNGIRR
ncbi:MAG: hypothetical protein FWD88_02610 [Treponema sp.]|nr:hypothetical protein [Treponema sp.]